MRYSKELLKGSTPLLVLSVLKGQDLYGYKIIRELEIRSENVFCIFRRGRCPHRPARLGNIPRDRRADEDIRPYGVTGGLYVS